MALIECNWRASITVLVAGLLISSLTGCAVGQRFDYRNAKPSISLHTKGSVSVGAQDRRQYVVSGIKNERFVGLLRGGFGTPFDVTTKSKQPFASDVAAILASAIEKDGARITPLDIKPNANRDEVSNAIKLAKAESAIVLTINEWKTDSSLTTSLYFDLLLEEFDSEGHVKRASKASGLDKIDGYQWSLNPQAVITKGATTILKNKIEELFAGLAVVSDNKNPSARLKDIQRLFEQGLISRDEHEQKRREILNGI